MNTQNTLFSSLRFFSTFARRFDWEKFFLVLLFVALPLMVFYNLDVNPRPWHDEGAILSVPMTLAEDGVYATRNYGGYQTFGPVQSAGPTVVLPIAVLYKIFGVTLLHGRIIAGIYALMAVIFIYLCGVELFGRREALLAVFFLLASPAAKFLLFGRHVLGDIPALAFFLGGYWAWIKGTKAKRIGYFVLSGCMFGLAIITKTQYLPMVGVTLFFILVLDLFYYRSKIFTSAITTGIISLLWFVGWTVWQINYFGLDTYRANAQTFSELAGVTTGFSIDTTAQALQFIFGTGSGFLYGFWGFFALIYTLYVCMKREGMSIGIAFGFIFQLLWMGYFVFWTIPWTPYFIVPGTIIALFVGKIVSDVMRETLNGWELMITSPDKNRVVLFFGSLMAIMALMGFMLYQFQLVLRLDVLDTVGVQTAEFRKPPEFSDPSDISKFIAENIPANAVIDTWERELGLLNNRNTFHYPDQSMLVFTHAALYRGAPSTYSLGADYFHESKADYVIVGWWGRLTNIYDLEYLEKNTQYIGTVGSKEWGYDIYKIHP